MKWSLTPSEHFDLVKSLQNAIDKALSIPSQSEPQLIANLVWGLPRAINNKSFTGGWTLECGGVFVHAQPFAKCNNFPAPTPESVELGDLLLLRTEKRGKTVTDQRALLLQAKKVSGFPATPDNKNQHHLYANWPHFQYKRSTDMLNGQERHITGQDLYFASRYLLIADHAPCPLYCSFPCLHCVQTASPTRPDLSHYRCFPSELLDFLLGDAGKKYKEPKHPSNKNWDKVIKDLKTVTAERSSAFVKRASGGPEDTRGQGALTFLSGVEPTNDEVLAQLWRSTVPPSEDRNQEPPPVPEMGTQGDAPPSVPEMRTEGDGPPPVPENWPEGGDDGGAISIIEFTVSREDRAE